MTAGTSRGLAITGLMALVLLATVSSPGAGALLASAPLALLALAGALALPYWSIATAIVMLPYFSYGVMELLANPPERLPAALFSATCIGVFLLALDSRRRGAG